MERKPPIKVALIGCGYWGANLCRALSQHPDFDVGWVCDARESARDRAQRLAPKARLTGDAAYPLSDPEITAVVIATPAATHATLGAEAIESGKHVLVEKPLASAAADAESLCDAAERSGRVLMVGHTFLYNGAVRRVRSMIEHGDLGEIRYFFLRRLNLGIVRQDVDALWNLAPHDLSILDYWHPQDITQVAAVGHSYLQPGLADVVFAHYTYADGVAAHVQVSWLDPRKVRDAVIVGSKKMLIYDDVATDARITLFDRGIDALDLTATLGEYDSYAAHQLIVRAGDVWMPRVEYPEPLAVELDEFAGAIRQGRAPLTDGRHGLRIVRLLERTSRAMESNDD
jgi:predicted dehydrogenase